MANPFTAPNRHGELQDVTGDGSVNFGDTFLGDLLGVDGTVGLQGRAGMLKSLQGARRQQPVDPAAAQQAAPAQSPRGPIQGGVPTDEPPVAQPGEAVPPEVTTTPLNAEDMPIGMEELLAAGIGAGTVAAAGAAAKRVLGAKERVTPSMKNEVALTPDEQGKVRVPRQTNRGTRYEVLDAKQAADGGWTVVGLNYADSGLPPPTPETAPTSKGRNAGRAVAAGAESGAGIDNIDGTTADVQKGAPKTAPAAPPVTATNAADAPITTEELMSPAPKTAPEGSTVIPDPTSGQTPARMMDTGQKTATGQQIFSDLANGGYNVRTDAGWVNFPQGTDIQAVIRGAVRGAM